MFTRFTSKLAVAAVVAAMPAVVSFAASNSAYAADPQYAIVSVSSAGTPGTQLSGLGDYWPIAASHDGSKVAFMSWSTDLDPEAAASAPPGPQVYLRDRANSTTQLVSTTASGAALNDGVFRFKMSANGRWLVFGTWATNVGLGHSTGINLYERNLSTGAVTWVGAANTASEQNFAVTDDGAVVQGVVTATPDGRYVIPLDPTGETTRLLDTQSGISRLVSAAADGTPANGQAGLATTALTPDGKYVAFWSTATNLVPDFEGTCPPNNCGALYLKNMDTGAIREIAPSLANTGAQAGQQVSLSNDGNLVGFCQNGASLPNDDPGVPQLGAAVYDVATDTLTDVAQDGGTKLYAGSFDCPSIVVGDGSAVIIEGSRSLSEQHPLPVQVWAEPINPGQVALPGPWGTPLTVTVTGTQTYGGSTTYTATYSGFTGNDGPAQATGSIHCFTADRGNSDIDPNLPVGDHTIDGASCTGLSVNSDTIYDITYVGGTLTVTPASTPLTVTVTGTQTYGGAATYTATYSGLAGSDTPADVTGTLTCGTVDGGTPIDAHLPAGQHTIDGASCTGLSVNSNTTYDITYGGTLTVAPATLEVTASDATMSYGQPVPPLTASIITGFVNGENATTAGLAGTPDCTTTATSTSPVGTYPITCTDGTLAAPNYTFTHHSGTLTVAATTTVTGTSRGGATVGAGQSLYLAPGSVTHGGITVQDGGSVDVEGGTINGSVTVTGAGAIRLCGATFSGGLTITGSPQLVTVGDPSGSSCAGNTIHGSATVTGNTGGVLFNHNSITGSLTIQGNTGPVVAVGNNVGGAASIQ